MEQDRYPSVGLYLVRELISMKETFEDIVDAVDAKDEEICKEMKFMLGEVRSDLINMMISEAETQRQLRKEIESLKDTIIKSEATINSWKKRVVRSKKKPLVTPTGKQTKLLKQLTYKPTPDAFEEFE